MKVALVTDGIWPYVMGGMQKHSYYLCKYLAKKKIDVDLYHFNQSQLNIEALDVFTEEEKKHINSILVPFPTSNKLPGHYLRNSYQYSRSVAQAMSAKISSYDFIYTKGFTGWYLLEKKSKGELKCAPIGIKLHGYEMFQPSPNLKTKIQHVVLLRRPAQKLSRMADVVFSYGGNISSILRSIGVSKEKIIEIPSGIEASELSQNIKASEQKLHFLYLGRYERRKGIEELNSAISSLPETISSTCVFHFIGDIPVNKHLKQYNVQYHGEIRDKEVLNKKISSCDVLLCPSYSEGFPNVILESMSKGLSVAATNVGAVGLLVNEDTGWIIPSSSAMNIANTITTIVNTPRQKLDGKKTKCLELIRTHFTWEVLIERFIHMLLKK